MSTTPAVSVIIPHYGDLEGLNLCLVALAGQSYPQADFEIVVADNGSPEGEAAVVDVIGGRARLVVVRQRGAGPARNGGAAAARGEILAFTDCDCRPEPEWLRQGVNALGEADVVGGRVRVLVDDESRMTATEAFERVFAFDNERYVRRKGFSVTANLFCSRALFNRVGGFRVGVSEDTEWSHRALGIGARLAYAPRAVVGHPARRTWAELIGKWRRMSAERYALVKVGPAGRLRWFVRSCALPASAIIHTLRVLTTSRLVTVSQRLGALGVLYRLRFWRAGDAWRLLAADGALDGQVNGRLGPDGSDSV